MGDFLTFPFPRGQPTVDDFRKPVLRNSDGAGKLELASGLFNDQSFQSQVNHENLLQIAIILLIAVQKKLNGRLFYKMINLLRYIL